MLHSPSWMDLIFPTTLVTMLLWDYGIWPKEDICLKLNWTCFVIDELAQVFIWTEPTLHWLELNNDITFLLKLLYSRFRICLIIEVRILFCTILWGYYLYCVKHYRNKGKEQQEHGHRVSKSAVCHQNKFLLYENISGNKALSDSE